MVTDPQPPGFSSPHCAAHRQPAVATCVRCGGFLCGACTEVRDEAAYCTACLAFLTTHGGASRALRWTVGLEGGALLFAAFVWWSPRWMSFDADVVRLLFLARLPVLQGLAAVLGFRLGAREQGRAELSSSARRWIRGARVLAVPNLLYTVWVLVLLASLIAPRFLK